MSKQPVHILLDAPIYLEAKSQQLNLSQICNELLTEYLQVKEPNTNISHIEAQLAKKKEEMEELQQQMNRLSVSLVHAREQWVKQEKDNLSQAKAMIEAARASRIVEEVFR